MPRAADIVDDFFGSGVTRQHRPRRRRGVGRETAASDRGRHDEVAAPTTDGDEALYRLVAPQLVRYATMLVGPSDAPDVVANAVIASFTSPGWADVADRRAYLFRATTTKARDHVRTVAGRRRREEAASRAFVERWTGEARPEVVEAVAELSPRQRAVIHLTYWEDLTPPAVAAVLGISDGSVRRHLARARAHLRTRLAPEVHDREESTG